MLWTPCAYRQTKLNIWCHNLRLGLEILYCKITKKNQMITICGRRFCSERSDFPIIKIANFLSNVHHRGKTSDRFCFLKTLQLKLQGELWGIYQNSSEENFWWRLMACLMYIIWCRVVNEDLFFALFMVESLAITQKISSKLTTDTRAFVSFKYDFLCAAVLYAIPWYTGPYYDGTRLLLTKTAGSI